MASQAPNPESTAPDPGPAVAVSLPEVTLEETADEEKFDCPPPWWLALIAVAMSVMTTMTVAGSLFFVLAAPEKVSPHCREYETEALANLCTFSVCCFWTYPIVCCLFVVLVFAKNMVDQRVYYEFLLHKVHLGFDRANPFAYPTVIFLLVYALCAFSALIWLGITHQRKAQSPLDTVFSSLAYISPIVSFLAILLAQWSIQGKLITLPNFLEDFTWGMKHLNGTHNYHIESVHFGYKRLEHALDKSDGKDLTTPHMIALVEYYTKEYQADLARQQEALEKAAKEKAAASPDGETEQFSARALVGSLQDGVGMLGSVTGEMSSAVMTEDTDFVYWQWRLLFNPRLQDERSQNFRNWALGYFVSVVVGILLSIYLFICLLVTCLEMEKVLVKGGAAWEWTHSFSLRPDLQHEQDEALYRNFKQVAAKAAGNVIRDGSRMLRTGVHAVSQFQLGVAN